jgi:hypothetical protein
MLGRRLAASLMVVWFVGSASLVAAERSGSDLLPRSCVVYAEISRPAELIDTVLDHPLVRQIESHPDYRRALESPEYKEYLAAIELAEARLAMKIRPAISKLTAEGIFVGVDLPTQSVAVLVRSSDAELTVKARDTLLELARADAESKGKPDPVKPGEYRDIAVHEVDDIRIAAHEAWLIVTSKPLLMRLVLNNALDDDPPALTQDEQFQALYTARPEGSAAWFYGDLRLVKGLGLLKDVLGQKSDNPAIELLAGGVIGAIPNAAYVTGSLQVEQSRLGLTVSIPADTREVARQREFYFGAKGIGVAPPLLEPKQTIASLSTYRDFGSMWRNAPDLFTEQINAQFAEAEAGLTTLFSGRNFRDDILGNLEPGLQLVVARQTFEEATVVPALKLPAGAIVVRMKSPEETARIFKVTFQSVIGFLNVVGGMNGIDPLDVNSEKQGERLVVSAEYLPPKDPAQRKEAPPQFNVSPTALFVGDRFILSTTKQLALDLAELVVSEGPAANESRLNTLVRTDAQMLREVLADNREPLIAQNMLENGHDRTQAENEINGLLDALQHVRDAAVRLESDDRSLSLSVELRLVPSDK